MSKLSIEDAYHALEVKVTSATTLDHIHKAYRLKALLCHPDRNPNDVDKATAEFQVVQSAYPLLKTEFELI